MTATDQTTKSDKCHTCEGIGWAPGGNPNLGEPERICPDCYGSGTCQDRSHRHRRAQQGWWER
jgi:DnaJ-class molecular chaperone